MNRAEFLASWSPDIAAAQDAVAKAKAALDEADFQIWARDYPKLPEDMLRELWAIQRGR